MVHRNQKSNAISFTFTETVKLVILNLFIAAIFDLQKLWSSDCEKTIIRIIY